MMKYVATAPASDPCYVHAKVAEGGGGGGDAGLEH